MKKLLMASIFVAAVATPALADDQYTLVKDTVGNCSAVVSSDAGYPGMTVVGTQGYPSIQAANSALDSVSGCDGLVR